MVNEFNGNGDSSELALNKLTKTFDIFLERRVQCELSVLKPELQKIKEVVKDKLGVDIDTKS